MAGVTLVLSYFHADLTLYRPTNGLLTDGNTYHFLQLQGLNLVHTTLERKKSLRAVFNALCSMFSEGRPQYSVEDSSDDLLTNHGKRRRTTAIPMRSLDLPSPTVTMTTTTTTTVTTTTTTPSTSRRHPRIAPLPHAGSGPTTRSKSRQAKGHESKKVGYKAGKDERRFRKDRTRKVLVVE